MGCLGYEFLVFVKVHELLNNSYLITLSQKVISLAAVFIVQTRIVKALKKLFLTQ